MANAGNHRRIKDGRSMYYTETCMSHTAAVNNTYIKTWIFNSGIPRIIFNYASNLGNNTLCCRPRSGVDPGSSIEWNLGESGLGSEMAANTDKR